MMFNRCKHQWAEVARYWNKPERITLEADRISEHSFNQFLQMYRGWTNIELRCTVCGDIKFVEADGKAT